MKGFTTLHTISGVPIDVANRLDEDGHLEIVWGGHDRDFDVEGRYLSPDEAIALATRLLRSAQKKADA